MTMQELTAAVGRLHQDIVALLAAPRLEVSTRKKLAEVAQEALRLSQEMSKLNTELAVQQSKTGLLTQAGAFLLRWVPFLTRLQNVSAPDQLGPGN